MSENSNISNRSIKAVFWGTIGSGGRILLQLLAQVVLTRILGPEQYGLFAIGAIVVSFSAFFSDVGIAYGLIQKKAVTDEDVRFILTWQLVMGLTVATIVYFLAPTLSAFFNDVRTVPIIRFLSIVCLINALTAPSLNLLKRKLDFKSIHLAQLLSYICGYLVVGIPLAIAGHQVWSLVSAWLVQAIVNLFVLYNRTRHPLKLLLWHCDSRSLSSYGITVFGTNVVNWVTNNIDRVIVGRMFNSIGVGLYSTSYNLVSTNALTLMGVLQSSLFSASARVEDSSSRLRAFLAVVGSLGLFVVPVFVGIAAVSETIILSLYGSAWLKAADTLRPLALAMPFFLLIGMATPMLWTAGQTTREFKIQIPMAVMWITGSYIAAQHSVAAVAWTVFGLFALRAVVVTRATISALEVRFAILKGLLGGCLTVSTIVAIVLLLTDMALRSVSKVPIVWLCADVTMAAVALISSLKIFPGLIADEVVALLEKLLKFVPPRAAAWIL